jgi:NodT family efflux transporter outer membrane factor (OMF) lipoprotein
MKTKPNISFRVALLAALALLLAGCGGAQTTPYVTPEVNMPANWQGRTGPLSDAANKNAKAKSAAGITMEELADRALGFKDPELGRLLALALKRNNDLAAAAIKVRQARLKAGLKAEALFPTASAEVSGHYTRNLDTGDNDNSHSASGSLSYEVDLWGKLAREKDMSVWEAEASEEDRQSAALALLGTTAELYFQIAYLNESIALGQESIVRATKSLELAQVRHRAGADSSLEELEARRALASLQANQKDLLRQRAVKRTAMAVLFDGPPEVIVTDPKSLPRRPLPAVEEGLPAALLGRRPDLKAAELRLRQALANVDVERTSYYPTLSLTGTLGSTSSALLEVVKNPVASLLASVSFPFLQWNQMQLNVKLAKAEYEEAVVNFRQTLYGALKEVEDALSSREYYAAQGAELQKALAASRLVEQRYETRYRAGADSMRVWLDAQETRQNAEATLLSNRLNRLTNHLVLYQALGGEPLKPGKES